MIENIDAVIFDFDGTLYDYKKLPLNLILSSPLNMFRIKAERDARKKLKGKDFCTEEAFRKAYVSEVASLTGLDEAGAAAWCNQGYPALVMNVLKKKYSKREDAEDVFKKLADCGIKTAVYSDYSKVAERMAAVGFKEGVCSNLFSAEEKGGLKPCSRPFLEIAAELGAAPERCLVVGDRNDTDGEGAREAGMLFVQIITHKTPDTDFSAGHPVILWDDFAASVLD